MFHALAYSATLRGASQSAWHILIRFTIDCIKQAQNQVVFRNIRHQIAVILVADKTLFVDHHQRRDAPEFEQVDFLSIKIGNGMFWVGQADKGQSFVRPVAGKRLGAIGANRQNDRVTRGKSREIVAQAREMGAAIRSKEPAQEDQDNVFLTFELRKPDGIAITIGEFEIGCDGENFHGMIPLDVIASEPYFGERSNPQLLEFLR
jgi:hypothetical protein